MNKYEIRRAVPADMEEILRVYAIARRFMAENGNPTQWAGGYPQREQLEADMVRGALYAVTEGDTIRGVFFFAIGDDPTYAEIENGSWRCTAPYGVIHRIASDGSGGIFSACLAFCRERISHLRIDTHRDNHPMQHVVEKHGFTRRGIIHVADGSERIAYDLI